MTRCLPAGSTLLPVALLLALLAGRGRAHSPHDVVRAVAVSPDFADDQLVLGAFLLIDHELFGRSEDGGRSWIHTGGPQLEGTVTVIRFSPHVAQDHTVFVGTAAGTVWRSEDRGRHFVPATAGLPAAAVNDLLVSPDYDQDQTVLAATTQGLWRSTDRGLTWLPASAGLLDLELNALLSAGDDRYAAGEHLYRSTDDGLTWTPLAALGAVAVDLAASPTLASDGLLAVCFGRNADGVALSTDGGLNWSPHGLEDEAVNQVAIAGDGRLFAVSRQAACYRADQAFAPWSLFDEGFEVLSPLTANHFTTLDLSPAYTSDGTLFVGGFEGLHRAQDGGQVWRQQEIFPQRLNRRVLLPPSWPRRRTVLLGNYGGAVYSGVDPAQVGEGGLTLTGLGSQTPPQVHDAVPTVPWQSAAQGLTGLYTEALLVSPDHTADRTLFYGFNGLWRSTDDAQSWTNLGLPPGVDVARALGISPDFAVDGTLFLGTSQQGLWRSADRGGSWTDVSAGLPPDTRTAHILPAPGFAAHGIALLASRNRGLHRSVDGGSSWSVPPGWSGPDGLRALALSPDFLSDGTVLVGSVGQGLFRSTDGGLSFTPSNAGLPGDTPLIVEALAFSPAFAADRTVYAALLDGGLQVSHDGGASWSAVAAQGLTEAAPRDLALSPAFADDRTLYLSTYDWVWRSRDGGQSFSAVSGYQRLDDTLDTVYSHDPDWTQEPEPSAFASALVSAERPGAWREVELFGHTIGWLASRDEAAGRALVLLDGQAQEVVDLYAPSPQAVTTVFGRSFEEAGWHTLRIEVLGTAHPDSAGTRVTSDGFLRRW